jgi:hypothetical protein
MLKPTLKLLAATAALLCASHAVAQDSGPLIDLLVKKGIVNDQEAEDLRAELTKDFASTSAGKLNLSTPMTEFRIAGDVRIRYEDRRADVGSDDVGRDRFRYRFRAGLYGKMLNNWSWGVRLETATGSRSSNVTVGDDAAGPFAKNSDGVYVGQIFIQYAPTPEWTFTGGRMPNPLVNTLLVWDGDINPEGFAEQYKHRLDKFEFGGTFAQFLYNAANTQKVLGATSNVQDLGLFAYQANVRYYTGEGTTAFLQVSPTLYQYINESGVNNPVPFRGNFTPGNIFGINNLFVLDIPIEYDWLIGGVPTRVFGDFAVNLDADARARKYGRPDLGSSEDKAWQLGLQYGKAVNPGEWDMKVGYQSTGAFALDPNLVDSDIFDSRVNMKGWFISANYAVGAATQVTITYANGDRKNKTLPAIGSGDTGTNNNIDNYNLWQLDLNLKF